MRNIKVRIKLKILSIVTQRHDIYFKFITFSRLPIRRYLTRASEKASLNKDSRIGSIYLSEILVFLTLHALQYVTKSRTEHFKF
jgi:hypothetical protein